MAANHDLSLSHRLQTAVETLSAEEGSLKERLKHSLLSLSPVLHDKGIQNYREELDEISAAMGRVQELSADEADHSARKIVRLAFKVAADTEAGFR